MTGAAGCLYMCCFRDARSCCADDRHCTHGLIGPSRSRCRHLYRGQGIVDPTEVAMTSMENRPRTALLVIDMQNGIVGKAHERDRVIANIQALVDKARAEHVPVLWV